MGRTKTKAIVPEPMATESNRDALCVVHSITASSSWTVAMVGKKRSDTSRCITERCFGVGCQLRRRDASVMDWAKPRVQSSSALRATVGQWNISSCSDRSRLKAVLNRSPPASLSDRRCGLMGVWVGNWRFMLLPLGFAQGGTRCYLSGLAYQAHTIRGPRRAVGGG